MSVYDLPESVEIGGADHAIRSDFRAVLDVIGVMCDGSLAEDERSYLVLSIFYPGFDSMRPSDYQEALDRCVWFVGGGEEPKGGKKPKLMDWQQDFPLIVAPVNKALGFEARAADHLHWWTFLAAYQEIGDCLFAQVVGIRKKKLLGKKLDKSDQAFYNEHRDLVDFRHETTPEEDALVAAWTRN